MSPKVTILGIGNLLLKDDGLGIHALELLKERYEFPQGVELVDGGVLGLGLMGVLTEAEYVIVLDSIKNGGRPGQIYRIQDPDIITRMRGKNSLHEIDFLETLSACELLGKRPRCVILGIEPKEIYQVDIQLSQEVFESMEDLIQLAIQELKGSWH
jgi:hydrogenase maturation protease